MQATPGANAYTPNTVFFKALRITFFWQFTLMAESPGMTCARQLLNAYGYAYLEEETSFPFSFSHFLMNSVHLLDAFWKKKDKMIVDALL